MFYNMNHLQYNYWVIIQEIFINLKKLVNEDTRKRNLFELEMEEN